MTNPPREPPATAKPTAIGDAHTDKPRNQLHRTDLRDSARNLPQTKLKNSPTIHGAARGGMGRLTSGGLVGHAERGDAVGALGVEDVAVLRVGDVAVGSPAGEALEDLPRHGARVGRRRAVLRQHHRPARHHRVQDRHLRRAPRLASPPASGCRADAGGGGGGRRRRGERLN